MNLVLFNSSIIMSYSHILSLFLYNPYNPLMIFLYVLGMFTSIINHGTKSEIMKYIDRLTMFFGFFIDLYFIRQIYINTKSNKAIIVILILLISSTTLYFLSKLVKSNIKHTDDINHIDENVDEKTEKLFVGNFLHSCAHICISITHIFIIKEYSSLE